MSGKFLVTAELDTAVAVRYTDSGMSHGKWKTQPSGIAPQGTSQIFVATNRDGASVGPEGWASYVAGDGTEFKFTFVDPGSKANNCSSSMSDVSGPYSLPTPSYPSSGKKWTVTYKIALTSSFFDAPVFASDLLGTDMCEDYPEDRVRAWVAGRSCIRMHDVLAESDVPLLGKVWCATHPLFLTSTSKSLLLVSLAEAALQELARSEILPQRLRDDIFQSHRDFGGGIAPLSQLLDLGRQLTERMPELGSEDDRDREILDTLGALLVPDADTGWANGVNSYLGWSRDALWDERASRVLNLVESRL